MTGALIIDKPSGPTSHDVVACVRRAFGVQRVGHTGTLDPLATGVLVLLVGRATRLAQFLALDEKEYVADVQLGIETATYDAASWPVFFSRGFRLQAEDLLPVLEQFRGTYEQAPPPFSAKKIAGKRAYEHARRREPVELQPVEVTVRDLEILSSTSEGCLRLRIVCSAGFYVRSLAHDIGQRLGCGAHLQSLRRTRAGRFTLEEAAPLDLIVAGGATASSRLVPPSELLGHLPAVTLIEEGITRVSHGNSIAREHLDAPLPSLSRGSRVRLLGPAGGLLAIADCGHDGLLHPVVVLV